MLFCKKCGTNLDDDADFCHSCGTPVVKSKPLKPGASAADLGKTIPRNKPVYGVINLENLPVGHIIDERYQIKAKLGQGGFGAVYLAYDRKMEIDKALKVIPEAIVHDEEAMETLQKEARTMIRLNHSHIVRVYDFHDSGNINFIDMEYMDGESLTRLKLRQPEKRLREEKVKAYAIQIAEALAYAHRQGVIHRDIKPQNIMVTQVGELKLMDFGIAETVRTSMSRIANVSTSGTLLYMSPEQVLGEAIGKEADIYSFGSTLYELLSGQPPFSRGDISYQILHKEPALIPDISADMNAFLQKCLAKNPKERCRNFEEVMEVMKAGAQIREESERSERSEEPGEILGIEWVAVSGGSFKMGDTFCDGFSNECPVRKVKVDSFYLSKYPVTQAVYEKVMGVNPSSFIGVNRPVENVSWFDAVKFCNRLSQRKGLEPVYHINGRKVWWVRSANGYRLPTEAEWEYASRGGALTRGFKYAGSNNSTLIAWYENNSGGRSHSVMQKKPNELGIFDMSGNVWEWVWDWYNSKFYQHGSINNPTGPPSGKYKVMRGGSWAIASDGLRCSIRNFNLPTRMSSDDGFRIAKKLVNQSI